MSKALILVGGYGTRLRPLTLSKPKPLVEFINKPILVHQIEALKKVGVNEVVLAINYQLDKFEKVVKKFEQDYQIKITSSIEKEPLGTAGPIGLAKKILASGEGNEIFIFNADITCKFPLEDMLKFHRNHGKEGTIAVTKVKDPSRFGVIITDEKRMILKFVEKPKEYIGNEINAGLYIFNKKFLDRVEAKPTSIEREIFPKMAEDKELYSYELKGFWADIGKPADFLKGTELYLNEIYQSNRSQLAPESEQIKKNVLIDPTAKIEEGAVLGPNVVIGAECIIKKGARIQNSVIMNKTVVNEYAFIEGSIIGWKSKIGKWSRIDGLSILGEDVTIKDEVALHKNIVLSYVNIKSNPKEGEIIMF